MFGLVETNVEIALENKLLLHLSICINVQQGVTGRKAGVLTLPKDHLLKADIFWQSC